MNPFHQTTDNLALTSWIWLSRKDISINSQSAYSIASQSMLSFDLLQPLRQWLDNIEIRNPDLAHRLCQSIPARCPFEREIKFMGRTILYIPPMCKLNPLYEQVIALRFRALCYLADECGEDITLYC
ncbi:MAG: Mo-dependent nitrogenase C-terminal domain-containing protein [Scytolyngbya sp. HA4215-MV1]|nr:Mo-dependent nitrogenase C-terminal domain-containing protein [Scytolyngbya sp. HA4215-MV1]